MKSFKQYLAENASQPATHAGVKGKTVTINKQADGTQWSTGSVVQITPDNAADTYNLQLTDGNTKQVVLTPTQTHAISKGEYVVATHDGFEFFFGKDPSDGEATE